MKLCVFGLTISSSWGNGHATLWRGLCRALAAAGHEVVFFERDVPYYARHRDQVAPDGCDLRLYDTWSSAAREARRAIDDADVAIVTSYCPDAVAATALVIEHARRRVFYDLDSPVTLARLEAGEAIDYLPPDGLGGFQLVLSYGGGPTLRALRDRLGARAVAPLYGSADPAVHRPAAADPALAGAASYLGTYAADRQGALDALFVEPCRRLADRRFVLGGSQYPPEVTWPDNLVHLEHVAPDRHAAFYASSPVTINVTRAAMASSGYAPSGRLFEAAACGACVVSDDWPGLADFFEPGVEILIARSADEATEAIARPAAALAAIGAAARRRALASHTARHRADELVAQLEQL